jgi:hypothetical protein
MAFCEIELSTGLVIQPDTAEVVVHTREAETTEHPVEDGSAIADHIILKPKTFSVTTNWTPRPWDSSFLPGGTNRPQQAFDILAGVLQSKQPVWIQIDDIDYRPVVITNVTMQRQFDDGDGRTIQLECKEIQIYQGKTVTVQIANALKAKGTTKKKKLTPKPVAVINGMLDLGVEAQQTIAIPEITKFLTGIDTQYVNPTPSSNYTNRQRAQRYNILDAGKL